MADSVILAARFVVEHGIEAVSAGLAAGSIELKLVVRIVASLLCYICPSTIFIVLFHEVRESVVACHARARRWSATWQVSIVKDGFLPIIAALTTKRIGKRRIISAVVLECTSTPDVKVFDFPCLAVDIVVLHKKGASVIAPRATGSGFGGKRGRWRCW